MAKDEFSNCCNSEITRPHTDNFEIGLEMDNTAHHCLELLQDVPDNDLIVQPEKEPDQSKQEGSEMEKSLPFHWIGSSGQSRLQSEFSFICNLGKGGFGEVFKVKNNLDSQIYAIKRIKLDQKNKQLTRKLRREVELLSRLSTSSLHVFTISVTTNIRKKSHKILYVFSEIKYGKNRG